MKKLILPFLFLISGCKELEAETKTYEPPVVCAVEDMAIVADDDTNGGWYSLSLSASLDRDQLGEQLKITMNNEVMLDTCAVTSADGFAVYPYDSTFYLSMNFKRNIAWRNDYFDASGEPVRTDLNLKVETRSRCEDAWVTVVPSTNASIAWSKNSGGCTPPGYYGYLTVPVVVSY